MAHKRGFTLVEIMIVVAIIALLAAIAIPGILRQRLNTNESAALLTLSTLSSALQNFQGANPIPGFPVDLSELAPAGTPAYLDATMALAANTFIRQGYNFTYVPGVVNLGFRTQYHLHANALIQGGTGLRGFYIDEAGVLCVINPWTAAPAHAVVGATCPDAYAPLV